MVTATQKRQKARNLERAEQELGALFVKRTPFHWQRSLVDGTVIDYWPSTGKCQFNGIVKEVSIPEMLEVLRGGY